MWGCLVQSLNSLLFPGVIRGHRAIVAINLSDDAEPCELKRQTSVSRCGENGIGRQGFDRSF